MRNTYFVILCDDDEVSGSNDELSHRLLVASVYVCTDLGCVVTLVNVLVINLAVSAIYHRLEHMFHAIGQDFGTTHCVEAAFGKLVINH